MDRGEFIKDGYTVEPSDGGSFVVVRGGARWHREGYLPEMRGFTNHADMLAWLGDEHTFLATPNTSPPDLDRKD